MAKTRMSMPFGRILVAALLLSLSSSGWGLDLKVSTVLPGNSANSATTLRGRDAITVVFSRPVIAIGEDFGDGPLPDRFLPFSIFDRRLNTVSNVPGKFRWVTTYILRFDTDIDWPSDLDLYLKFKESYQSFSGVTLSAPDGDYNFVTPALTMSLGEVVSPLAMEYTAGHWSGTAAPLVPDTVAEVPPDGKMKLFFSSPVDASLLSSNLVIKKVTLFNNAPALPFSVEACTTSAANCVSVRVNSPLESNNVVYRLELPSGSTYHPYAGKLGSTVSIQFSGLIPFSIPFLQVSPYGLDTWQQMIPSYRRYRGWLRHGLAEGVTVSDLMQCMSLPVSGVTIEKLDNGTFQLQGPFEQEQLYQIDVHSGCNNVKDGFGLALTGSNTQFYTSPYPSVFADVSSDVTFVKGMRDPSTWMSYIGGKRSEQNVAYTDYTTNRQHSFNKKTVLTRVGLDSTSVKQAIASLYSSSTSHLPSSSSNLEVNAYALNIGTSNGAVVYEVDTTSISDTGIILRDKYDHASYSCSSMGCSYGEGKTSTLVQSSGMIATILSHPVEKVSGSVTSEGLMQVWVVDAETGSPVEGATAKLFLFSPFSGSQPLSPSSIDELKAATTDANGVAEFLIPPSYLAISYNVQAALLVTHKGKGFIVRNAALPPAYQRAEDQLAATFVFDRTLFKPTDTVYVKGYVKVQRNEFTSREDKAILEGLIRGATFEVKFAWPKKNEDGSTSTIMEAVSVTVDPELGTFSASAVVPANAMYADATVSCYRNSRLLVSDTLKIADPRLPTSTLTVEVEDEVKERSNVVEPDQTFDVTIKSSTYTGIAIDGTATATWKIVSASSLGGVFWPCHWERPEAWYTYFGVSDGLYRGVSAPACARVDIAQPLSARTLLTEAEGTIEVELVNGEAKLSLSARHLAPNAKLSDSSTLTLSLDMMGPTGETLKEQVEMTISSALYVASIATTPNEPLPGREFAADVQVSHVSSGAPISDAEVTIALIEWDGSDVEYASIPSLLDADMLVVGNSAHSKYIGLRGGRVHSTCTQGGSASAALALEGGEGGGGGESGGRCGFVVPQLGHFALVANVSDPLGRNVFAVRVVGRTQEQWDASPLLTLDGTYQYGAESVVEGGEWKVTLSSPFDNTAVMTSVGKAGSYTSTTFTIAKGEGQEKVIPLPSTCKNVPLGEEPCVGTITLVSPIQTTASIMPISVPVSPLIDVRSPTYTVRTFTLRSAEASVAGVPQLDLTVEASGSATRSGEVGEPGKEAYITVKVSELDAAVMSNAEKMDLCVFVVDESFLDIHPYSMPDVGEWAASSSIASLSPSLPSSSSSLSTSTSPDFSQIKSIWSDRITQDPFVTPSANVKYLSGTQSWWGPLSYPVETPTASYLRQFYSTITHYQSSYGYIPQQLRAHLDEYAAAGGIAGGAAGGGDVMEMDMGIEMAMATNASPRMAKSATMEMASASAAAPRAVKVRSNFLATPLALLHKEIEATSTDATVTFTLPDNIGRMVVRAYLSVRTTSSPTVLHASAETKLTVSKPLSLQSKLPRFARIGDTFSGGVSATLDLRGRVRVSDGQSVSATASSSIEVGKGFAVVNEEGGEMSSGTPSATATQSAPIQVRQGEEAGSADMTSSPTSLLFSLSAERLGWYNISVTTITSVSMTSSGSGGSSITAGTYSDGIQKELEVVGQQPAVFVSTSMAMNADPTSEWTQHSEGVVFPEAVPGSGSVNITASAGHYSLVQSVEKELFNAVHNPQYWKSGYLYLSYLGSLLAYVPYGVDAEWRQQWDACLSTLQYTYTDSQLGLVYRKNQYSWRYVDTRLNAYALSLARLAAEQGVGLPPALLSTWRTALLRGLRESAESARRYNGRYSDFSTLAFAYFGLGVNVQLQNEGMSGYIVDDLSLSRLGDHLDQAGQEGQAAFILAHVLPDNTAITSSMRGGGGGRGGRGEEGRWTERRAVLKRMREGTHAESGGSAGAMPGEAPTLLKRRRRGQVEKVKTMEARAPAVDPPTLMMDTSIASEVGRKEESKVGRSEGRASREGKKKRRGEYEARQSPVNVAKVEAEVGVEVEGPARAPKKAGRDLLSWNDDSTARVVRVMKNMQGMMRVRGRTAYIAQRAGSQYSAGEFANGMILLAFSKARQYIRTEYDMEVNHQLTEKLANYLTQRNPSWRYCSQYGKVSTSWGVSAYDAVSGASTPDVHFKASAGELSLSSAHFTSPSDTASESGVGWDRVADALANASSGSSESGSNSIVFATKGRGEVSVVAGLTFIPARVFNDPVYRGIQVQKIMQVEVVARSGTKPAGAVTVGDYVEVTVQLITPDDLENVIVEDHLPAGLEPLDSDDTDLNSVCAPTYSYANSYGGGGFVGGSVGMSVGMASSSSMSSSWYWFLPGCSFIYKEVKPQQVSFYAPRLRAGTHTVTFKARAVTIGTFTLPPTKVYAANEPEIMGLSGGGQLKVTQTEEEAVTLNANREETFRRVGLLSIPQQCPSYCDVCNAKTGACMCEREGGGMEECNAAEVEALIEDHEDESTPPPLTPAEQAGIGVSSSVVVVGAVVAIAIVAVRYRRSHRVPLIRRARVSPTSSFSGDVENSPRHGQAISLSSSRTSVESRGSGRQKKKSEIEM
mmetsp:Transcript_40315/g.104524  ORF Transcript_40315/g.104524 Transcript_40315/m.104524 type:complete len:2609 (-) Transcript_40315:679-8505(-)